ncbi:MAG TPA: PAS domain-containing protein [Cyclobacteriaceae bacterium]
MSGLAFSFVRKSKIEAQKKLTKELQSEIGESLDFIKAIGEGNLSASLSRDVAESAIGQSLMNMQYKLKQISEGEHQRNWASEGMAQVIPILQETDKNLTQLYDRVIQYIVKYMNVNQGALYLLNSDQEGEFLEMKACVAYGRKKYFDQRIDVYSGLVGQAVLEKGSIYLTDIPKDYIKITSGLGEALPTSILIVPLKTDKQVVGAIEIASFEKIPPYKISFLEKVAESIALTISSLRTSELTTRLLTEAKNRADQLLQQEEELRQNMEELTSQQETISRQMKESERMRKDLEIREEVFGYTTILSETDPHGTITYVNSKFCEVSGYSVHELVGKPQNVVRHPDMPREVFKLMWQTIKQGKVFKGIVKNSTKSGGHYWVDATIVPVKDDTGKIIKYIGARYHIQEDSLAEFLYQRQMEELGLELALV